MMSWQPFHSKQCMTHTLPHHEPESQWSVNNSWSSILGLSRLYADQSAHNWTIDYLYSQKYNISQEIHEFQINWYGKLHSIQTCIIGCWKCDFDRILLTDCKTRASYVSPGARSVAPKIKGQNYTPSSSQNSSCHADFTQWVACTLSTTQ
jgi:hypothetical protein